MQKIGKLILNKYFVTFLWFGLSLFAVLKQAAHHHINNYSVYKYTFINLIHQQTLYVGQPRFYFDTNHYGPLFALLIAPFTALPDFAGAILWTIFNALVLYIAIWQLPLTVNQRLAILLISAHEMMTAAFAVQYNPCVAAFIILSFVLVNRKQDFWATLFIVFGALTKVYGIVGLAFFFFSKDKVKFMWSFALWSVVLFLLPMLITSPHYIIQSYHEWAESLMHKNLENAESHMQDISVMGMIRRIFKNPAFPNLPVIVPAIILFGTAYLKVKWFDNPKFRLLLLASTLIFTVIYSSSSESPTYIIAFVGVAIWFMNLNRPVTGFEIFLLIFALLITSLSPSDLFPQVINKHYIKPYGLKALPCFVIWLRIVYEILTRDFNREDSNEVVAL